MGHEREHKPRAATHTGKASTPKPNAVAGKSTPVQRGKACTQDDLDRVADRVDRLENRVEVAEASKDYGDAVLAAEVHYQTALLNARMDLLTAAPKDSSGLIVWLDLISGMLTSIAIGRAERALGGYRDAAQAAAKEAHDPLVDMSGGRNPGPVEAATGVPVSGRGENMGKALLKAGTGKAVVGQIGRQVRNLLVHAKQPGDDTREREAQWIEGLQDAAGPMFAFIRDQLPKLNHWTAEQYRAAADALTSHNHAVSDYAADIRAMLESYRASRVDEIGEGQEMYGKSRKELTRVSRVAADGSAEGRWAIVEYFEPNRNQPVKGVHAGNGKTKIVPFETPVFVSWVSDEHSGTAIGYQRARNRDESRDLETGQMRNPEGNVKMIEAFDPPTGMSEIDTWRGIKPAAAPVNAPPAQPPQEASTLAVSAPTGITPSSSGRAE